MKNSVKKALLLVAHGSRRAMSNDEIRELAERLSADADNQFDMVSAAFLELAKPSIPDGIQQCIEQGATKVVVFPYFLSAGRHVVEDIPEQIVGKREQYPEIEIVVAEYLGAAADMPAMILHQVTDSRATD